MKTPYDLNENASRIVYVKPVAVADLQVSRRFGQRSTEGNFFNVLKAANTQAKSRR